MRFCRIRIARKCRRIFKSKTRRPLACKQCKETLKKLGTNAWSWLHMNKEPVESIKWESKDKAIVTVEKENEVTHLANNKKKVVGSVKEVAKFNTTAEELEEGIEMLKGMVVKTQAQISAQQNGLTLIGDIPPKTNEVIRLEKALEILAKNQQAKQHKDKIEELTKTLDGQKKQLESRKNMMEIRPKE